MDTKRPRHDGRSDRWVGVPVEQRKAAMRVATEAKMRKSREARIAALIESAPPFTPEQRAKLIALLNANATQDAA